MPASVSMLALIEAGAEKLLPKDFHAFLTIVLEKTGADSAPKLALADWLDEQDEAELALGFRYMGRRGRHPNEIYVNSKTQWEWVGGSDTLDAPQDLPGHITGNKGYGRVSWRRSDTFLGAVVVLAKRLQEILTDMDLTK